MINSSFLTHFSFKITIFAYQKYELQIYIFLFGQTKCSENLNKNHLQSTKTAPSNEFIQNINMKLTLLAIGKTNSEELIRLFEDYRKRLTHYISFDTTIIPELKNTKNLSVAEQKEKEGELLLKNIDPQDEVILLDEKGKEYTSVDFAAFLEKKSLSSIKRMIFVIGGPYGFSDKVYQRANSRISLSKMTFSHQMIRVIFIEQLYRAMTIQKGEPYHHE